MSYKIEIYTKQGCPFCDKAKSFFIKRCLDFKEISIDNDSLKIKYLEMCNRAKGGTTVPQIFINDYHIGGADDLIKFSSNSKKFNDLLYCQRI